VASEVRNCLIDVVIAAHKKPKHRVSPVLAMCVLCNRVRELTRSYVAGTRFASTSP
jgi:hypothetical protein